MKIYKCLCSGDELFTDAFKFTEVNGFYKIKGKSTKESTKIDESKLGSNPSAEEACEGADDTEIHGIDVVLKNRLCETAQFPNKKAYKAYFRDFVKELKEEVAAANPDKDMKAWQDSITKAFAWISEFIGDCQCFTGHSGCSTIVLMNWEKPEDEDTMDESPYFYVYKDAVKEEKV